MSKTIKDKCRPKSRTISSSTTRRNTDPHQAATGFLERIHDKTEALDPIVFREEDPELVQALIRTRLAVRKQSGVLVRSRATLTPSELEQARDRLVEAFKLIQGPYKRVEDDLFPRLTSSIGETTGAYTFEDPTK